MIHEIAMVPGPVSYQVWVLAAWHSLPRLLYLTHKPFILADQFHARIGRRHGRAKGVADLIRQGLPKIDLPKGLGWRVFEVAAEWALKLEWWFMIADRTTEFELNWISLAYEYAGIRHPGDIYAGGGWAPHVGHYFDERALPLGVLGPITSVGCGADGYGPILAPGQVGMFTFTFIAGKHPIYTDIATHIDTEIVVHSGGQTRSFKTRLVGDPIHGQYSSNDLFHWDGSAPGTTSIYATASGNGWAVIEEYAWQFYGHSTGTRGLLFDP